MSNCSAYERIGKELEDCIQGIENFKSRNDEKYLLSVYNSTNEFEKHILENYDDAGILEKSLCRNDNSNLSIKIRQLQQMNLNLGNFLEKKSDSNLNLEDMKSFLEKWKNRCFYLKENAEDSHNFNAYRWGE